MLAYRELSRDPHRVENDMEAWTVKVETVVSHCPMWSVTDKKLVSTCS